MTVAVLLVLLATVVYALKLPLWETVVGALLLSPVVAFLLGHLLTYSGGLAWISLAITIAGFSYFFKQTERKFDLTLLILIIGFVVNFQLCLLWPDFFPNGERLRDYALLSSAISSPVNAIEPWFSGIPIHYYMYWYRLGAWLSFALDLPVWLVYHALQSLTYAIFTSSVFWICHQGLKFRWPMALAATLVTAFGSNVAGILFFLNQENGWWGPSRVIPGAINEFPLWSFILGDLHPHYLDLGLIPFAVAILIGSWRQLSTRDWFLPTMLAVGILMPLWVYTSNAWEVPVWGLLAALVGICFLVRARGDLPNLRSPSRRAISLSAVLLLLTFALYLMSRDVSSGDWPWRFVKDPIPRSGVWDYFRHWGVALSMIVVGLVASDKNPLRQFAQTFLILFSIGSGSALAVLLVLLLFVTARFFETLRKDPEKSRWWAIGLAALIFVTVPEVVFLDDPYGGENERMNTIFKLYSASWIWMYIFGFFLMSQIPQKLSSWGQYCAIAAALFLTLGFTYRAIDERRLSNFTIEPREQGLSTIDREYPGAGHTIQTLAMLKPGVVLEAQGDAYSFATHLATLSGNFGFLGWLNHLGLLYSGNPELDRRAKVTDDFYKSGNCDDKRNIMVREGIRYAALGPLEKKKYPEAKAEDFHCLSRVAGEGQYAIFGAL